MIENLKKTEEEGSEDKEEKIDDWWNIILLEGCNILYINTTYHCTFTVWPHYLSALQTNVTNKIMWVSSKVINYTFTDTPYLACMDLCKLEEVSENLPCR